MESDALESKKEATPATDKHYLVWRKGDTPV